MSVDKEESKCLPPDRKRNLRLLRFEEDRRAEYDRQGIPRWVRDRRKEGLEAFRVYVLGGCGCGKTSLIHKRMSRDGVDFPSAQDNYRIEEPYEWRGETIMNQLEVIEIKSEHSGDVVAFNGQYPTGYVICFSMDDAPSFIKAKRLVSHLKRSAQGLHAFVLIGCKWDVPIDRVQVDAQDASAFAERVGVSFIRTSKDSQQDVFFRVSELLLKNVQTYRRAQGVILAEDTNRAPSPGSTDQHDLFQCFFPSRGCDCNSNERKRISISISGDVPVSSATHEVEEEETKEYHRQTNFKDSKSRWRSSRGDILTPADGCVLS